MNRIKQFVSLMGLMIFIIPLAFCQNSSTSNNLDPCQVVLERMFDSVYALKHVKFEMLAKERIDGEMLKSHSLGVVQYEPRKIFIRGLDAEKVLLNEILYVADENDGKALISPNGFPYFNLNLDPLGSTMRNNHHLTILEAGGRYLVDMLRLGLEVYLHNGDEISDRFTLYREKEGEIKLVLNNPDYEIISYKVDRKQSVREFCFTHGIPEYKMVEINAEVEISDELKKDQEIKIPNLYAKKFELILRESDYVPLQVRIFDDQGLFAEYKYLEFNTDPIINNQTFSSDNPAYTF